MSANTETQADLTGRDRMAVNVLAGYAGYAIFIVAGFVLPRMVDRHLGQVGLGIWDFGWNVVGCFGLVQMGISSSVNRYVALHRAAGDVEGLRRSMASVNLLLMGAAGIIACVAAAAALALPLLPRYQQQLAGHMGDAQWVILLLGSTVAMTTCCDVFGGVITGCHRWDLHNAISAGFYTLITIGLVVVLMSGGGLRWMAAIYAGGTLLQELTRVAVAYRVCPELSVHPRHARRDAAGEMFSFGGKTVVPRLAELMIGEIITVQIAYYLGPAALAMYSRPRSLIRHVRTLVAKFAYVLTPTASSLQARDDLQEVRRLLTTATRYAAHVCLPMLLVLGLVGDLLLDAWMRSDYAGGYIILIVLGAGYLATICLQPAGSILTGLNVHGRPGIAVFIASVASVISAHIALKHFQAGLMGTALCVAIPLFLADGIFVPIYVCKKLGLSLRGFLAESMLRPLACAAPIGAALLLGRWLGETLRPGGSWPALLLAVGFGGLVALPIYWKYVVPARLRERWTERLRRGGRERANSLGVSPGKPDVA